MVWQVIVREKGEWKNEIVACMKYSAVLLGGLCLCFIINSFCYSAPEWKSYLAYNNSRTLLYDYTDFLSTEQYADSHAVYGMTAEEYQILYSYNTMLDASIDEHKMQGVAEAVSSEMHQEIGFGQRLKDCILKYYMQMRYGDVPYNYIWIAVYLLLVLGFIICKKCLPLLVLGIFGIGRSAVWMYLIWRGRFPERVSLSLYIIEFMILLAMSIQVVQDEKILKKPIKRIGSVVLVLWLVCLCGYQWQSTTGKVQSRADIQKEWTMLKEYCAENADRLYLMDVFSAVEYADLHYTEDSENIMLLGGWMSASPLAEERLAKFASEDAAEALFFQDSVSLIAEKDIDVGWLEAYLQSRFGECKLAKVAEISDQGSKIFVEYRVTCP